MRILDIERKGNVLRFYLGEEEEWWGDDWDDVPYEHNAGRVYDEFIKMQVDIAVPFDYGVYEAGEDYTYKGNTPYCKDDFKKIPFIVIVKDTQWDDKYSIVALNNDVLKITLGDDFNKIKEKLISYGCIILG